MKRDELKAMLYVMLALVALAPVVAWVVKRLTEAQP